jgi:membrane-bound inhibitor of C-type lysozyme
MMRILLNNFAVPRGALAAWLILAAAPASAQTFAEYACDDGTPVTAAFVREPRSISLQIDGKSVNLPLRAAISGTRYKKSGFTFWIKRDRVLFKRPRARETVCRHR